MISVIITVFEKIKSCFIKTSFPVFSFIAVTSDIIKNIAKIITDILT